MRRTTLGMGMLATAMVANGCSATSSACSRSISPSDDDQTSAQAMFEAARDGETLCFTPGTYRFTDPIEIRDHADITIQGTGASREDVVLDFLGQEIGMNGLSATRMTDVTITHLTVLDAVGNDVFVTGSDGVVMRDVRAGWVGRTGADRGKYALYPVSSRRVLIEDCEAFESTDTGIYVGQAVDCIVRNNEAYGNPAGIEIENSTNCEVYGNDMHDNAGGIAVFELPGLALSGRGTSVHDNHVHDNNIANAGGGIVGMLPSGTGIMAFTARDVEIFDNVIERNRSTGVLVASYATLESFGVVEPNADPAYTTIGEHIWIHDNVFTANGADPQGILVAVASFGMVATLEDVLWDGMELPDASDANFCSTGAGTFRVAYGESGLMTQSTDRTPFECSSTPRAPVEL